MTGSLSTDLTIGRWFSDRARGTPQRTAIEWGTAPISYIGLYRAVNDAGGAFQELGARPGDRIAVLSGNRPEYVALVAACASSGMVVVPLNWRQTPAELTYQLDDSGASVLVVSPELTDLAERSVGAARGEPAVVDLIELTPSLLNDPEGVISGAPSPEEVTERPAEPRPAVEDGSPLFLVYTSGTTGRPKGAVLTHANVFWANLVLDRTSEVTSTDVVLQVLPQFHVGGWNCQPLLAWWKGATVLLEPSFDAQRVLHLISERRVTTMMGVPANYQFLAEHPEFDRADLSSLRYVLVGGGPMPEVLLRRYEERGVRIVQGYGLTEAAPNVLCLSADDASRRLGSAGKPYPHVDVALSSAEDGTLLDGEATGELLVRGPNVFAGYWGNPAATAEVMRDGWLHTGDIAARDAEGFYRIVGRIKDMYVSGGENVYPAEVETVITSHPAVAEAAVVGVADPKWGESGLAAVVLRPGAALDEEGLRSWCAERLARYKVPRDVRFIDALPRTPMNKVSKADLQRSLAQDLTGPSIPRP